MVRNLFMLEFKDYKSAKRVLKDSPWMMNGCSMVVRHWEDRLKLEQIDSSVVELWVQFHRLRLDQMCKEKAEKLGEAIGRLIEVDHLDNGQSARKNFLRVRVAFNIDSPLVERI